MIIWMIGLSASGKTTLGREVVRQWKLSEPNTVLVDGDEMRRIFGADGAPSDYSVDGRRRNAERIVGICEWLDDQAINAVCCIVSIFHDMQLENRQRFGRYFEVFVDTPLAVARQRDRKGVYEQTRHRSPVVGVDIPFLPPPKADLRIDNSPEGGDIPGMARLILETAGVRTAESTVGVG